MLHLIPQSFVMIRLPFALVVSLLAASTAAPAQTSDLKPGLADVAFLVGNWTAGIGKVADAGGTARGASTITAEADGAVLLRRDHTDLYDADGKPSGSFDQIMIIYPEDGTLHADYSDRGHVIHYTSASVVPGRSVAFTTASQPGMPTYRLSYATTISDTLSVSFEVEAPGKTSFFPVATGTLRKHP